jgi:hypothetical protein
LEATEETIMNCHYRAAKNSTEVVKLFVQYAWTNTETQNI